MPDITTNLGLKKPLGNETFNRASYNENLDILDQNAAKASALAAHLADTANPHATTAAQVGAVPSSHIGAGGSAHANAIAGGAAGFMTAADKLKLDGIESGATADMTATEILNTVKTVDGVGSDLDADLLDGQHGSYYATATHNHDSTYVALAGSIMTGVLTCRNATDYTTKQARNITLSTSDPSGGGNGDIWLKYTA